MMILSYDNRLVLTFIEAMNLCKNGCLFFCQMKIIELYLWEEKEKKKPHPQYKDNRFKKH
jgi:hypothetical protein